jgi:hypothetical protein
MLALALALLAGPPSIEHAARVQGPAIVAVHAANAVRPGFFVAGSGVLVAVVPDAPDIVVELPSGERRKARVLVRDDDGLALVEVKKLDKDTTFPSLALGQGAPPTSSQWLLGIGLEDGKPAPSVGGLRSADGPRWRLDLPLDPGAPILVDERVIGVVVERHGKTACVAVPVERVLSLVKRIP